MVLQAVALIAAQRAAACTANCSAVCVHKARPNSQIPNSMVRYTGNNIAISIAVVPSRVDHSRWQTLLEGDAAAGSAQELAHDLQLVNH